MAGKASPDYDRAEEVATQKNGVVMEHGRFFRITAAAVLLATWFAPLLDAHDEPTVDELKARVASSNVSDRPPLCIRIAERRLDEADKLFLAGDSEKAQAALADVVTFSESARDYSIQSRKHEKPSEIAIRKMARKLESLKHTVSHEEQEQLQNSVDRLERIRDDLLAAMFPKGIIR